MSSQKQYARVDDDNKVVEFPIYENQIVNRGHVTSMYHEVIPSIKLPLRDNETYEKSFDIFDGKVFLKWSVVLLKPDQYYKRIVKNMNTVFDSIVPTHMPAKVDVNIEKLQEMRPLLIECVDSWIDELCDEYAIKLGYKNGDRLASYAADPHDSWRLDAEKYIGIRSNAYTYVFTVFNLDSLVQENKIPTSIRPMLDSISNLFKGN